MGVLESTKSFFSKFFDKLHSEFLPIHHFFISAQVAVFTRPMIVPKIVLALANVGISAKTVLVLVKRVKTDHRWSNELYCELIHSKSFII